MSVIAELRPGFWEAAEKLHVAREPNTPPPGTHALIDCPFDYDGVMKLGAELSRAASTRTIAFAIQTTADVHEVRVFENGEQSRRLGYGRDEGGWIHVEGTAQPWEPLYLFDMFSPYDDEDGEDAESLLATARAKNDPLMVLQHLHPSSTVHAHALCESFGLKGDRPDAKWKKPSLFSRLFGR